MFNVKQHKFTSQGTFLLQSPSLFFNLLSLLYPKRRSQQLILQLLCLHCTLKRVGIFLKFDSQVRRRLSLPSPSMKALFITRYFFLRFQSVFFLSHATRRFEFGWRPTLLRPKAKHKAPMPRETVNRAWKVLGIQGTLSLPRRLFQGSSFFIPPHKRLLNQRQHSFPKLSQSHGTFQILES